MLSWTRPLHWSSLFISLQAADHVASINGDDASGHESRGIGGQQEQGPIEIRGTTEPALGNALDETGTFFGRKEIAIQIGLEVPGRQGITTYPESRQLERQLLGHLNYGGL